jgi:hypothetical protein
LGINVAAGVELKLSPPLSPTDWKLTFDGQSISLDPSIGNWSFPCQSHYWIKEDRVRWAPRWSQQEIDAGRRHDHKAKEQYFGMGKQVSPNRPDAKLESRLREGLWSKLKRWLS